MALDNWKNHIDKRKGYLFLSKPKALSVYHPWRTLNILFFYVHIFYNQYRLISNINTVITFYLYL